MDGGYVCVYVCMRERDRAVERRGTERLEREREGERGDKRVRERREKTDSECHGTRKREKEKKPSLLRQ